MSEHDEAVVLCQWMDLRGIVYFHVPNEGKRRPGAAAKLKREGLKAGVPDYVILSEPTGDAHDWGRTSPIFLELKSKTGKLSLEQREWITTLTDLKYLSGYCNGADDAIAWLQSLGY